MTKPLDEDNNALNRIKEQQLKLGEVPDNDDFEIDGLDDRCAKVVDAYGSQCGNTCCNTKKTDETGYSNFSNAEPSTMYYSRKERFKEQKKEFVRKVVRSSVILLTVLSIVGLGICVYTQKFAQSSSSFKSLNMKFRRAQPINTQRQQFLKLALLSVSDRDALEERLSPQYKALLWISHEDPMKLPIPTTEAQRRKLVQRYALACLYFSTSGYKWKAKHNFLSKLDECEWNEIDQNGYFNGSGGCGVDGDVTMIALWDNGLDGEVPEELSKLTKLKILSLYSNSIYGTLPTELKDLEQLETLYLHGNKISGDLGFFCDHDINDFRSDCHGTTSMIKCKCCSVCCNAGGVCYQTS